MMPKDRKLRVLIAGSRELPAHVCIPIITEILSIWLNPENKVFWDIELVHGDARGVDRFAELAWKQMVSVFNEDDIKRFPFIKGVGKAGGMMRNKVMAKYCDQAFLIWDGESPGTMNMKKCLESERKPHYLITVKNDKEVDRKKFSYTYDESTLLRFFEC